MERILIEGVVEHGRRLGRELGFPTANLAVPEDVAAADGVYRSRAEVGGKVYDAMSNLGRNPSVGGVERRLETHIFDFRGELYGRWLRVELLEKIPRRTPVRFGGGTARADCQGQGIYFRIEIMCPYFGQKPGCVATSPSRGRGLGWGQTCKRGGTPRVSTRQIRTNDAIT